MPSHPISQWPIEDRPREKCLRKGARELSTTECIALLFRHGHKGESALSLAQRLWQAQGEDLQRLTSTNPDTWMHVAGLGPAKAAALAAAFELGRRMQAGEGGGLLRKTVRSSGDGFALLRPKLEALDHEEFWVIYLSRAHQVLQMDCIGKGGWTGTVADLRVLFQRALELRAPAILVAHNHPSGRLQPSPEDRDLTQRMIQVGRFLDIVLLDHLIVGRGDYVSFADKGWLNANP
jgi:DNA repair protein RadC